MSNNLDSNSNKSLKKILADYSRHEPVHILNTEYRYRIDAQQKFLQAYKESFQSGLPEDPTANNKNHTDRTNHTKNWDKLVMRLLRQSLIW